MSTDQLITECAGLGMTQLRLRLALARNRIRDAKAEIADLEHGVRTRLYADVSGDVKQLGSNEQIREDRYRSEYGRDPHWLKLTVTAITASDEAEILEVVLNGRLDGLTERRLAIDERVILAGASA